MTKNEFIKKWADKIIKSLPWATVHMTQTSQMLQESMRQDLDAVDGSARSDLVLALWEISMMPCNNPIIQDLPDGTRKYLRCVFRVELMQPGEQFCPSCTAKEAYDKWKAYEKAY